MPVKLVPSNAGGDTVREAASFLGVCTSTVYKLCAEGKLGHFRVSNAIRISAVALQSYE
jgi:excisionase family DNA binding protein